MKYPTPWVGMLCVLLTLLTPPLALAEDWNNAGEGDWFDPLNWTPNAVPTSSTDANINNGGTAQADDSTASGALQAQNVHVGVNGGSGILESSGVNLEAQFPLQIGVIQPGHIGGGIATGHAHFINADILPFPQGGSDEYNVGAAFATGNGVGRLEVVNGEMASETVIRVGYARIEVGDANFSGVADGTLILRSITTLGATGIRVGEALAGAAGSSATASADVHLEDVVVSSPFRVGDATVRGSNASASVVATASLADSTFTSSMRLVEVDFSTNDDPPDAKAQVNVTAELDRIVADFGEFVIVQCNANGVDSLILPSRADVTVADSSIENELFDLAEVDSGDSAGAECTAVVTFEDSTLVSGAGGLNVAEGTVSDDGIANAVADLTLSDSTFAATGLDIGEGRANDNGVAVVDGRMTLIDSTAEATTQVRVGRWQGDGSSADGNRITARLMLEGSALDTPLLQIGVENPISLPLDALVTLNPSYLETDFLNVGPDGRLELFVQGPTPATRNNLNQNGLYAVAKAVDALIEGEVIVRIDYPARLGDTFDVLRTGPGALTGSPGTFRVAGAPSEAVSLEIVTEDGAEVLRVTALRNLPPPTTTPIPVRAPPALLFATLLLLLVISGAALRRVRESGSE